MDDNPITDMCIVSDPINCPGGYIVIDKTQDKKEDADMWKDGMWNRRKLRYLCVQTCSNLQGRNVLADVTIINEKEPVPHGYICLEFTSDTKERAMKKRQICVRYIASSLTQDAISDVAFLSRTKRPPSGYTLVGDLNSLQLCFKMTTLKIAQETMQQSAAPLPYSTPPTQNTEQLSYAISPTETNTMTRTHHKLERSISAYYNPMMGVPWQVNPRLEVQTPINNGPLPDMDLKNFEAIDNKYNYSFQVEKNALSQIATPSS